MNDQPPSHDPPDDLDDLYRRTSGLDSSRPSESVRRTVLEYAARQLTEPREGDTANNVTRLDARRKPPPDKTGVAANRRWQRPAIFGTLAAAALAGLLVTPHFLSEPPPPTMSLAGQATEAAGDRPAAVPPSPPAPSPPAPASAPSDALSPAAAPRAALAAPAPRAKASPFEAAPVPPLNPAGARQTESALARLLPAPSADVPAGTPRDESAATNPPPSNTVGGQQYGRALSRLAGNVPSTAAGRLNAPAFGASIAGAQAAKPDAPSLHRAAAAGDLVGLRKALDGGADINARDAAGRTALLLATLDGKAPLVDALLGRGADPNIADLQGTTPLKAALAADQPEIVDSLERAGAH